MKSILIVGVGGQGTLLASKILGAAFIGCGCDVKVSEVHGMSQRGGSVVTYVKSGEGGEKVHSPLIDFGEADIILSFELLEAARYLPYLKKGGTIITNTQRIDPMPVITGAAQYPEEIEGKLTAAGAKLVAVDALGMARAAGSEKSVNVALIGVLSKYLEIEQGIWHNAIKSCVKPAFEALNLKAFELGRANG